MTELLAALLGALLGGAVSAWASARQTAKVLKHETDLATQERREAEREAKDRRVLYAADHLISALADYTTVPSAASESLPLFVRVAATAQVHAERAARVSALMRSGMKHAHALPSGVHQRWDTLMWLVRYADSSQNDRALDLRQRDRMDLLHYAEYVRRSLVALGGQSQMPPHYVAPDPRRKGARPWGYKPEPGTSEPDLSDWSMSARLVGNVSFSSGENRWYGPGGHVESLPPDQADADGE